MRSEDIQELRRIASKLTGLQWARITAVMRFRKTALPLAISRLAGDTNFSEGVDKSQELLETHCVERWAGKIPRRRLTPLPVTPFQDFGNRKCSL